MYSDNKIICLCKNINTFIIKNVKKIGKNKIIIQPLINEFISWNSWFTTIEEEHRQCKCVFNSHNKLIKANANKNKKMCNKYKKLIHTTKNEKNISQNKVIELVDEIKQLTDKNRNLETENQELKKKLKINIINSLTVFEMNDTIYEPII
jgi:hypothetical protein